MLKGKRSNRQDTCNINGLLTLDNLNITATNNSVKLKIS